MTYTSAVSIRNLRWLICEGPILKFLRSFSLSLAPNEPHRGTAFSVSSSGFSEAADVVVVVMRSSNFSTEPNKRVGKMSFLEVLQKRKVCLVLATVAAMFEFSNSAILFPFDRSNESVGPRKSEKIRKKQKPQTETINI